jgi:hypothetical protein
MTTNLLRVTRSSAPTEFCQNATSASSSDSSDRWRFGSALLITALMATWITFSSIHRYHTADTLLPVLVSLLKWTPFYWGQNRFGMLIPLLAAPVHSPFANLLFQTWLGAFAGLFATFLLLRYALRSGLTWLIAGTIVNLAAVLVLPLQVQCDWFGGEPYALSLTLALSAFLLLEKGTALRWAIAVVLMLLAHWVNVAAFTLLAPLVALHYLLEKKRSDLTRLFPCLSVGAMCGLLMMQASHYKASTRLELDPVRNWLNAWIQQVHAIAKLETPHLLAFLFWLVVPAAALVIFMLIQPSLKTRDLAGAAALLGAGFVNWLFMGTLVWVRLNLYFLRYTLPALLFCMCGLVVLQVSFLERLIGAKRIFVITVLFTFVVIGHQYGRPSVAQVRNVINQQFGRMTDDILISNATLLAGDYWSVWPAVFHADLTLYERREQELVYGLTDRSSVTTPFWSSIPQSELCVAVPLGDTQANMYMDLARLHSVRREEHKTVNVFTFEDESSCRRPPRLNH